MQPGATSITVQFHLPSYECVFKAPKVIPSLFSGEKLVVYGIFKSSEKGPATLQGKAILIIAPFVVKKFISKSEVPNLARIPHLETQCLYRIVLLLLVPFHSLLLLLLCTLLLLWHSN